MMIKANELRSMLRAGRRFGGCGRYRKMPKWRGALEDAMYVVGGLAGLAIWAYVAYGLAKDFLN